MSSFQNVTVGQAWTGDIIVLEGGKGARRMKFSFACPRSSSYRFELWLPVCILSGWHTELYSLAIWRLALLHCSISPCLVGSSCNVLDPTIPLGKYTGGSVPTANLHLGPCEAHNILSSLSVGNHVLNALNLAQLPNQPHWTSPRRSLALSRCGGSSYT